MVSPNDSAEEDMADDIVKAQSLSLRISRINSDPSKCRCMRAVLRGDYGKIEEEAKSGLRRQRLYLVATDLSEEAAYALEWTIGTVLRDGDTLFAVYAMDISDVGESADAQSISAVNTEQQNAPTSGDGAKLMGDTFKMVRVLSNTVEKTVSAEPSTLDPKITNRLDISSSRHSSIGRFGSFSSPDVRGMGRGERERMKVVDSITDRVVHLLRKTKLQVRVIIDVIHSKNPRHIITEVVSLLPSKSIVLLVKKKLKLLLSQIDYLSPTLVILGSRGRSQVKNVLLGSFSNYLVTKSSVPVMVARKKLRKSKSFKRTNIRLSNVLQPAATTRGLANANIEKAISKGAS
jgi:nucleotide-binding universal stress UspA family protein